MRRSFLLPLAVLGASCSENVPAHVVIPGESFSQSIVASSDQGDTAHVRVNEWLTLRAIRTSGPWIHVARSDLRDDTCWLTRPPPDPEPAVADNLRWIVEPEGKAVFNLGIRPDHSRGVRFPEVGTYRLTGQSASICGDRYESNTLIVKVVGD